MHVLYLTNIPSPYRVNFFNELSAFCDLTVIYERETASDRDDSWIPEYNNKFNEITMKGIKVSRGFAFNPGIIKIIKNSNYDILVIGGYSSPTGMLAIEYCNKKGIPFILNADGGFVQNDHLLIDKVKSHLIGSAQAWLSTGSNTTNYLKNYGAELGRTYEYPFTSLYKNDILKKPLTKEEKTELRKKLAIKEGPTALSVGSFIHRKGFDTLIKSWKNMPSDYNLILIGGGEEKDNLVQLIKELELNNITLFEFIEPDLLVEYYKASDLFVFPTREDVWGLVINEAMGYGLPIVTTDKCAAGIELVDSTNGYIVQADDVGKLSLRIIEVLTNEELANDMSKSSLSKISKYTYEEMARVHYEVFESLNFRNIYDNYYIYE